MDEATRAQNRASDPAASTWLTANAGSGKTRVLTDRVARLLLAGCPPERILCLTYTRAAATEMQNRLLARLGEWAMLPEPALRAALAAIGAGQGADLPAARRLFARAIETPGGLKVQTIHAFCAAVLRRFPLEAGVPHGFVELDDRSATQLRAAILDQMAGAGLPEIADLTRLHSGARLDGWLAALTAADARMGPPDPAALRAFAGLAADDGVEDLLADVLGPGDGALIGAVIGLAGTGSANDRKLAAKLAAGDWQRPGLADLAILEDALLYGKTAKAAFAPKLGKILTRATQDRFAQSGALDALAQRVADNRPRRIGHGFLADALALHRFGHAFTRRYRAAKLARGWLDFDDLITRTEALLSAPDMAPWVLYRLDGGIEHILVDEAQDTAPAQWQVIRHLSDEFMAGKGSGGARSLFVVGDPKQSIYSFQGADIAVFRNRHAGFSAGFAAAGQPMQDAALQHSFRSSPAILRLVDAVFQDGAAEGLGGPPRHIAFHGAMPGRVDLWPVVAPPERPEDPAWDDPIDMIHPEDAPARLAEAVAAAVDAMRGQPIRSRSGAVRPIRAGDVLILVQRRSDLFHLIIAALKRRGLPVAGADRLKLGAEVAVSDIRALLAFLATPEDDLALAAALRSPLLGLSEDGLYRLAAGRGPGEFLWSRLRASGPAAAQAMLSDLIAASAARPYELISRILLRHGGRERLIARLGPEADDGIDELLSQALIYERAEAPSLTGFLAWLEGDEVEVRRQPGAAGDGEGLIRVMTVHGAKGLESPIVLIPDGAKRRAPRPDSFLRRADGPALPRGVAGARPERLEAAVAAEAEANEQERRRLLYVALTRAESWLILGAAGEAGDEGESWHALVAAGMARAEGLQPAPVETPLGPGLRLGFGDWPAPPAGDQPVGGQPADGVPLDGVPMDARHLAGPPPAGAQTGTSATDRPQADTRPADVGMVPGPSHHGPSPGDRVPADMPAPASPEPPPAALPDWLRQPAPPLRAPPQPVAASQLGGGMVLPGTAPDADALLAGTRLHLILEHWDRLAAPEDARALLAGAEGGAPDDAALAMLWAEAQAVTAAAGLTHLFAPQPGDTVLTEVALTAPIVDLPILHGVIDRLLVGPDRVLAIDYKSNALVPADPASVPPGILRQMAAYRLALQAIWPGRRIEVAILWTTARRLMQLPDSLLASEAARPRRPQVRDPLPPADLA